MLSQEKYTVFIKADGSCPLCHKAEALLKEHNIQYDTVGCASASDLPAGTTFPQIVVGDTMVGGYDMLCDRIDEPILQENPLRFTLFPIQYRSLFDMYRKALASFWTPQEISLAEDVADWKRLSDDDRYFIKHVLAFFAGSDGIVMENLAANFAKEVQIPEARQFYASQMLIEAVHCVAPETLVMTNEGCFPIESLCTRSVKVWNGEEFSQVTVVFTGQAPVLTVELSNGTSLDCTADHWWFVGTDKKQTKDLQPGDVLTPYVLPVLDPKRPSGKFDADALPWNEPLNAKVAWLQRYFERRVAFNPGDPEGVVIRSITQQHLRDLQTLFTTVGVCPRVIAGEMRLSARNLADLQSLGIDIPATNFFAEEDVFAQEDVSVTAVVDGGRVCDTYCFNEPKRHAGVFNGILTGQSEQYSLLIDALASPAEALGLFRAIETNDAVRKKAAWAAKYLARDRRFAERLIAFICVEGILFSGSFCAIYWLKRRGVMPGLCLSNEFISRDEALHYEFGVALYGHLKHRLSEATVKKIISEAVVTEEEFVTDALPVRLIGMNAELMCQYIRFVADRAVTDLGYSKIYNVQNPFPWMELIGLAGKSNFFEKFPSEYQRAGVLADTQEQIFALDGDF